MSKTCGPGCSGIQAGKARSASQGIDRGPAPFVVDIPRAVCGNSHFRAALWTGTYLQMTLMCIPPGEDIGIERHDEVDQFIRLEEGQGLVCMGRCRDRWDLQKEVRPDFGIFIPAGTWHNVINTGSGPMKAYSIYAPPQHPWGTIHKTKEEAEHEH